MSTSPTIPTLEHESVAPPFVVALNAPRIVSQAPCENCGSFNVLSTLVTSLAVYWRCQNCRELSVTKQSVPPDHIA